MPQAFDDCRAAGGKRRAVEVAHRFWSKVDVRSIDECWTWNGTLLKQSGYGQFCEKAGTRANRLRDAHRYLAHRMAWRLMRGPIPVGADVLHSCDFRLCCNPSHLFVGDQAANMADMKRKRRHLFGERSPNAKLTEEQACSVLRRASAGELHEHIANDFGVSRSTVSHIKTGRLWAHLQETTYASAV